MFDDQSSKKPHSASRPSGSSGRPRENPDPDLTASSAGALGGSSVQSDAAGEDAQKTVISNRAPEPSPAFRRAASPFEMGQVLEGEQLGHYQLEEFIGGGGMGAVFRATDTMLGRTVAVKVVSREQTQEETLKRFRNEAQSAARLDHPNIARVHYVGEDKGWNYIVFEYIEGVNVRDLVEASGALSLEDALSYTLQIAEALLHAAARDVVHRDIKPSNILIMEDGHAKLVDMGLARLHHVDSGNNDLTASGVTLGTFDYISPEQARDPRSTDVRGDLYSLGCTLYFMLTGEPPFADGTVLQKLLSHSSEDPPDPRTLRPDLPEELTAVVHKLLAKLPTQRYQTPSELIAELLLLADQLGLAGVRARSAVWIATSEAKPTLMQRHLPWLVPVATLMVAGWVMHWMGRPQESPVIPPPQFRENEVSLNDPEAAETERPKAVDYDSAQPDQENDTQGSTNRRTESGSPAGSSSDTLTDQSEMAPDGSAVSGTAASVEEDETAEQSSTAQAEFEDQPQPGRQSEGENAGEATGSDDERPAAEDENSGLDRTPVSRLDELDVLIVSDESIATKSNEQLVGTLNEALQMAAAAESVRRIELRFEGIRQLEPVSIDLGNLASRELVIQGAAQYEPIIQFEMKLDGVFQDPRPAMILIQSGHLKWEGIHFVLELGALDQQVQQASLFRLGESVNIDFHRCSFTIRNRHAADSTQPKQPKLSFFDIFDPTLQAGLLGSPNLSLTRQIPSVWLERCIARGPATLLRSERAMPFLLSWNQGVFISTERLIEIGGSPIQPRWEQGRATLFCQRLVSIADQGICLMVSDNSAPFQVGLAANCYDCLFATRASDRAEPLYQIRSDDPLAGEEIALDIGGSNNYYKNTDVVLQIKSPESMVPVNHFTFDDFSSTGRPSWFTEQNPQPATLFSWPPTTAPVQQQTIETFMTPGSSDGPFARVLEFDPLLLPTFPTLPTKTSNSQRTGQDELETPPVRGGQRIPDPSRPPATADRSTGGTLD